MVEKTRLNLGCGSAPNPAYLNVDVRKLEGVDVVADVRELTFQSETYKDSLENELEQGLHSTFGKCLK